MIYIKKIHNIFTKRFNFERMYLTPKNILVQNHSKLPPSEKEPIIIF
jgi:hypothetical protein